MSRLALSEEHSERVDKVLTELITKTNARCAILADISGQLLATTGRTKGLDATVLAALIASNVAATAEMARLLGERRHFQILFHQGEEQNLHLNTIGTSFLLAVVFSVNVQIGLVRLFSTKAVDALAKMAPEWEMQLMVPGAATANVPNDFAASLADELDSLWKSN